MDKLKHLQAQRKLSLGVVLFDGYELLDVFGPYELLCLTNITRSPLNISTISVEEGKVATASEGPKTITDYHIYDPSILEFDILFIPGGRGTRPLQDDKKFIAALKELSEKATTVFTVCTGSMLLAATGLLDGLKATTNKIAFDMIRKRYSTVDWVQESRWEVDGKYYTSSGVSAGLDLANFFISELYGKELARTMCEVAEYVPNENPRDDPFRDVKPLNTLHNKRDKPIKLAVLVYDNFEMLDTFGPMEMFGMVNKTAEQDGIRPLNFTFIGEEEVMKSSLGPKFRMDKTFEDDHSEGYDLLLLPGGIGTMREIYNPKMKAFLSNTIPGCEHVMTVCSGASILAQNGYLEGKRATTNKLAFHLLASYGNNVEWIKEARFVADGKFFTSSGVAAGTDLSLHLIEQLFGREAAITAAYRAEYVWNEDPFNDPFASTIPALHTTTKVSNWVQKAILGTVFKTGFAMGNRMYGVTSKLIPSATVFELLYK